MKSISPLITGYYVLYVRCLAVVISYWNHRMFQAALIFDAVCCAT